MEGWGDIFILIYMSYELCLVPKWNKNKLFNGIITEESKNC